MNRPVRRWAALAVVLALTATGCDNDDDSVGGSPIFNGCEAGAGSVIAFLQRTLDEIGAAEPGRLQEYEERFDFGVTALLQRAPEVHCTEAAFNRASITRVGELRAGGPAGELLIEDFVRIGLGSLDESRGGPLMLPGG